ncbi:MAG: GNAT family N-acetyltransferase [Chloroflexota bacterium]|nr:GNAT family N-acetyltransferase [Chloroflexota bacterium]MDQ6905846.1 GNAT family N-acetyltransferase [Chloroflexota bacterium]
MKHGSGPFLSRPFDPSTDLQPLLDLVVAANGDSRQPGQWHVGDVLWQMFRSDAFDATANIRLWYDDAGLLGFAWRDAEASAVLQLHPRAYDDGALEETMLTWVTRAWHARRNDSAPRSMTTYALESDARRLALLHRHGFARTGKHLLRVMHRDLDAAIPDAPPPDGAVIRPLVGDAEIAARVALHRDVWSNSQLTDASYTRMRGVPGYRPDLDIVAVMPDGAFASYCICWLDPVNRTGEFEPVGTRAAYRRRGVGRAVINEGLRRLQAHGARTAIVYSSGGNDASLALYRSAGFRVVNQEFAFERTW